MKLFIQFACGFKLTEYFKNPALYANAQVPALQIEELMAAKKFIEEAKQANDPQKLSELRASLSCAQFFVYRFINRVYFSTPKVSICNVLRKNILRTEESQPLTNRLAQVLDIDPSTADYFVICKFCQRDKLFAKKLIDNYKLLCLN